MPFHGYIRKKLCGYQSNLEQCLFSCSWRQLFPWHDFYGLFNLCKKTSLFYSLLTMFVTGNKQIGKNRENWDCLPHTTVAWDCNRKQTNGTNRENWDCLPIIKSGQGTLYKCLDMFLVFLLLFFFTKSIDIIFISSEKTYAVGHQNCLGEAILMVQQD